MRELALAAPVELLEEFNRELLVQRQSYFRMLKLINAMDQQGAAESLGYKDLIQVFKHTARWDTKTSRRRLNQAQAVCSTVTPTGSVIAPALPEVAAALADGVLSEEHVEVVAEAMAELPAAAEAPIVEFARDYDPRAVKDFCKKLAYRLDQDGPEPKEPAEPVAVANVLRRQRKGGRYQLVADLDPETGSILDALLEPLAKPGPEDLRLLPEREGDAFCEIIRLAQHADRQLDEQQRCPSSERVQVTVTVDFDQLRAGIGAAQLDDGERIPMGQVRRIACDSGIIPMLLGSQSQVYDVGRKTRAINTGLRRILTVRDRGCAFPGCGRPPRHCEAHHVRHWVDGGETNVDNLVLLCRLHHDLVHHSEWEVRMAGGLPVFRPPSFIDPQRKPRRNPLHTAA